MIRLEIESDESDAEENEPTDLVENAIDSKENDKFIPDTSEKLKEIFKNLHTDFEHLSKNLNLVFGELKRADILSSQECKAVLNQLKEEINFIQIPCVFDYLTTHT